MMSGEFEWFGSEIKLVRTGKFFRSGTPTTAGELQQFEARSCTLPDDYKRFVQRFGEVKLFRSAEGNDYQMVVYGFPHSHHIEAGKKFVMIGIRDGHTVYFALEQSGGGRLAVIEHRWSGGIVEVADTFSDWLSWAFKKQKAKYSKAAWAHIVDGPPPFSGEEAAIVAARLQWNVRKIGVDSRNNLILEVTNNSPRRFKYITVYIRCGSIQAHTPVRVEHVVPRVTSRCVTNFYKDQVSAADAELLPLIEIGPEDRALLFELNGPEWYRKRLALGEEMGSEMLDGP